MRACSVGSVAGLSVLVGALAALAGCTQLPPDVSPAASDSATATTQSVVQATDAAAPGVVPVGAPVARKERPLNLANPAIHNEIPDARFGAFAEVWSCGGREMVLGFHGQFLRVTAGAQSWNLPPQSASGANDGAAIAGSAYYRGVSNGAVTSVWRVPARTNQAASAQVVLDGMRLPTCERVRALPLPFEAQGVGSKGTERRWTLKADARQVTLRGDDELAILPLQAGQALTVGQGLSLSPVPEAPVIQVAHETCVDPVNGAAYPFKVSVQALGRTLPGCGGDPATLLQDRVWQISVPSGKGSQASVATIVFGRKGQVWGDGPCNRFSGRYVWQATQLSLQGLVNTQKACFGPVMAQERVLMDALARVVRMQVSSSGELSLLDAQGGALVAR